MLSIIIPVYNYNCVDLVTALSEQGDALVARLGIEDFDYEIIVAEDGSTDTLLVEENACITANKRVKHIRRNENIGRARILNFLVSQSKFAHVLIIDCDAQVFTTDYLFVYWQARHQADVVCGSIENAPYCPFGCELRYYYEESARQIRTLEYRNANPNSHLSTFNIMFARHVFDKVQFDERCTEYGYEDALFGLMLAPNGISIVHIENPLIHDGMDPSSVYLSKVETALRTLHRLGEPLHSASSLVRLVRKLNSWHLVPLVRGSFRLLRPLLRRQLFSHRPSMLCLKYYKLGYYLTLSKP